MNRFGLACEGITDHITLENILCGYFDDEPDLDEAIIQLQPSLDETDKVQSGFGGWEMLLEYLQSTRFRDDVLNVEYVVVQLDTDIAEHANFDVAYRQRLRAYHHKPVKFPVILFKAYKSLSFIRS